jgi:hypothetical protein
MPALLGTLLILFSSPLTAAYKVAYSKHAFYDSAFHSTDRHDIYSEFFDEAGLAPKTKWVQRLIYRHQNPSDCSKARFLATLGFDKGGLGAEMVGVASHLSYALANDFVLVWAKDVKSKYFNASAECRHLGYSCIFQALSSCESSILQQPETINEIYNIFLIPPRIEHVLHSHVPKISHAQALHWWKAQSVAYVMRINSRALESIVDMRKKNTSHYATGGIRLPYPLPSGSVNMHIRRGDKARHSGESDFIPAQKYIDAYTRLIATEPIGYMQRWVYLSSDSVEAVLEAVKLLEDSRGCTVAAVFSYMPRMQEGFDHQLWHVFPHNSTHGTLLLLMELLMALEADSWVGTRISVWGRIIDYLRCVWVNKCKQPYSEVGSLVQSGPGDQHMYYEFVIPSHATPYGKQQLIWDAPDSLLRKK